MPDDDFLALYNDELRYFLQAGEQFSRENPQVARHLGMHHDGVRDPFVERLLEGAAFLSSRVQQRLNYEQPEFALNMLARLAPYWSAPVPSMALIAIRPDLTYPQWDTHTTLPRGSKVVLSDPSLHGRTATFSTGTALHLQPVVIEEASYALLAPASLPEGVARHFQLSQSHLRIRLSTRGVVAVSQLRFSPLQLTLAGHQVKASQLLSLILLHTQKIVAWATCDRQTKVAELPASALRLGGLGDEDSLLPQVTGELPGCRILREYFAAPGLFCRVDIAGLQPFLSECRQAREFELFILLDRKVVTLLNQIGAADFALFATPVINLYRRRCDPVLLNHDRVEHPLIVDRLNASLYDVHSLCQVQGVNPQGEPIPLASPQGDRRYHQPGIPAVWSLRRRREPRASRYHNSGLPEEELFIALSMGEASGPAHALKALAVEALVCERHLIPAGLQQPVFQLQQTLPVHQTEIIRHPSSPQAVPPADKSWQALQLLAVNPLHYARPQVADCSALLKEWLMLFADPLQPTHQRRLDSIEHSAIGHRFERYRGAGPLAWTRGAEIALNLRRDHHADHGAVVFAAVIHHALSQYCELSQTLRMTLSLDGEPQISWENDRVG